MTPEPSTTTWVQALATAGVTIACLGIRILLVARSGRRAPAAPIGELCWFSPHRIGRAHVVHILRSHDNPEAGTPHGSDERWM
jgi:hypothetical protein